MNNMDFNELKAGDVLQGGTYRIERTIGADGFGITYMARNTRLNLVYAVKEFFINGCCTRSAGDKTVTPSGVDATVYEKCREKFIEEAQTLARLNHPNIVKVTDVFAENNTAYMATSYVEGETLQKIAEQRGRLNYDTAVNCIAQLSEAIRYIHEKNILHRDLNPDNIIITSDNRVTLFNFGAAREFAHSKIQLRTSVLAQGYAPLEQYTGKGSGETLSDIYALGAVSYFALTGQKPMDAATRTLEAMPEPKTLVPSIPDAANRAILKAMQLKPENRCRTVQEFLKNLQNPENKFQPSLESVRDFVDEKLKTKQYLSKLKIDRKYFKIAIPAIIIICAGIFFLMKPSTATYLAKVTLNGKVGFIDKTGKEVIPCKYDDAGTFSEGLAAVEFNGRWGFIDKTGEEVISCKYDEKWPFSEGLAAVELNGKWGYIDKTGKEEIPCKYDYAWSFFEGTAEVQLNGKHGLIDKTGKEIAPCKYDHAFYFSEGYTAVRLNGKYGFIDKTGKEVIPCKYDHAFYFSEGYVAVRLGKYGFIDKTGKEVIPYKYSDANSFSEGLFPVKFNDKWGFIDKTGKEVIPCKYDYANSFFGGLAFVRLKDRYGFINKTGKEVIPCKYNEAEIFSEGFVNVILNGRGGLLDKTGKEVVSCKYNGYIGNFSEGLANVRLEDRYGFIDKTGKEVIPCKYNMAGEFSEGFAGVQLNGKWGFIDKTGKEVIPCKYNGVLYFSEGFAGVQLNGKWGFIDKTGKEVIPCKYDALDNFHNIEKE
jgi:serine/threonine protein kinase